MLMRPDGNQLLPAGDNILCSQLGHLKFKSSHLTNLPNLGHRFSHIKPRPTFVCWPTLTTRIMTYELYINNQDTTYLEMFSHRCMTNFQKYI